MSPDPRSGASPAPVNWWSYATYVSRGISDPVDARNARLLAAITLVLPCLNLFGAFQAYRLAPAPGGRIIAQTLVAVALGYMVANVVARTRAYRVALGLTLVLQAGATQVITIRQGTYDEPAGLALGIWLSLPILTAATQMPYRHILV